MKKNLSATILILLLSLSSLNSYAQLNASALEIKIQELYIGILGRAADRPGQVYWRDQINAGIFTLENTRAAFTDPAQTEYTEIYGGLDFTQLVIAIYENFLERAPEALGLDYWVGELTSGRVNADQMINAIINAVRDPNAIGVESARDLAVLENKVAVAIYFTEQTKEYTFDISVREAARAAVSDVTDDPASMRLDEESWIFGPPSRAVLEPFREKIWQYCTTERVPDYEYSGEVEKGSIVSFFVQGETVADLWEDGYPDVLIPFNKGYASGIDTRIAPVLFKNDGYNFVESSAELVGGMPAIPGLRRTVAFENTSDELKGIFGVAHDTGDGQSADAVLFASGSSPRNITKTLPQLPLADELGRRNAVDAHSLAGGDLTGNGRIDFIVGEWLDSEGPYKLIQSITGQWEVVADPFLRSLLFDHYFELENPGAVEEGGNILIDMHLADFNGDSFDDLVAGWGHGSSKSYVYFNDGQGGFSNANKKPLPVSEYGVDNSLHLKTYSFDANGNGHLDMLVIYSRFKPYYGGYTLQLLINDGSGNFQDRTVSGMKNIAERSRAFAERLGWSDHFYLLDVDHDGLTDIVGSDQNAIRLWINAGDAVFEEIPVESYALGGNSIFVDMGNGEIHSLLFNQSWTDATGTEVCIWFDQAKLRMK